MSRRAVKETTKGKDKKVKGEGKESGRVKGGRHGNVKAQTGSIEKKELPSKIHLVNPSLALCRLPV